MNSEYLIPIRTAYTFFPFIAALFTLPYITYQYHKYGSVVFFRAAVVYSFILYMICAYFYIILPLPTFEYVLANPLSVRIQLNPLAFFYDIKEQAYWLYSGAESINTTHSAWFQAAANVLFFIPFGIYLRYYFKCSFGWILLLSFLLSLFFECTQLSALYGFYPAPYRTFDIDDLLFNTLGGILGYSFAPILTRPLPTKDELNRISYERGQKITWFRRFLSLLIDWAFLLPILWKAGSFFPSWLLYWAIVFCYFAGITFFTKGYTPGSFAVSIRLVTKDKEKPSLKHCCLRYGFFFYKKLSKTMFTSVAHIWCEEA